MRYFLRVGFFVFVFAPVTTFAKLEKLKPAEEPCNSLASSFTQGKAFTVNQTWDYSAQDRTLEDISDFMAKNETRTPAQLARRMKAAGNHWPSSIFSISASESLQRSQVDANNPRSFLYGNGLVFGFTGHSGNGADIRRANNRVEVIQYDKTNARFRFGLIDFNSTPPTLTEPDTCKRCHGEPARPIWQSSVKWDRATIQNSTDGRDSENQHETTQALNTSAVNDWREAVNMSTYLEALVARRAADELRGSQDFQKYKYALLGALASCQDLPEFLGAERRRHDERGTLESLRTNTHSIVEAGGRLQDAFIDMVITSAQKLTQLPRFRIREPELGSKNVESIEKNIAKSIEKPEDLPNTTSADIMASIRYLFEGRGPNVRNFSFDFSPSRRDFGYGMDASLMGCALFSDIPGRSRPVYTDEELNNRTNCTYLKRKSREQFPNRTAKSFVPGQDISGATHDSH